MLLKSRLGPIYTCKPPLGATENSALETRGATVSSIAIYRWELPNDLEPLRLAIEKITQSDTDIVLFTNGAQVDHLFRIAAEMHTVEKLRLALQRTVIGSVGPICTQVLEGFGIDPLNRLIPRWDRS